MGRYLTIIPFLCFFILNTASFAALADEPKAIVVKFCRNYSGQDKFLSDLSTNIINSRETRLELVHLLKVHKVKGCEQALGDYLDRIISGEHKKEDSKNFDSYLLLSFAADLPQATALIEKQIDKGELVEWLDVFEKADRESYFKALSRWVERMAALLRKLDHAPTLNAQAYGKNIHNLDKISPPDAIAIWNPLFINKYLSEVKTQNIRLSKKECAQLNIIYAASNQSYREIFVEDMASALKKSDVNWLASFREEPTWVQFRLFPVMGKVGGGLVKRELIWLSKYHESFQVRSVAQSTLEKINLATE